MIEVLAVSLIVLWIVDVLATVVLVRAAVQLHEAALDERATASVILSIGATGAALLAYAHLTGAVFHDGLLFAALAVGLLALSIPQLVWVVAYLTGRFR